MDPISSSEMDTSAKRARVKSTSGSVSSSNKKARLDDPMLYPDTIGELLSGIKGDFESVLTSGASMFSKAFSFFNESETAVVTAEADAAAAACRAKAAGARRRTGEQASQYATNEALAIAKQNEAMKIRLPSLWSSSAATSMNEAAEKASTLASKGPLRVAPAPAVRVKEGDVVNLSILGTKSSLASFECADDHVLIVGNRRMIMTQALPEDAAAATSSTGIKIKMARVAWSQALQDISGCTVSYDSSGSSQFTTKLEITLENSSRRLSMLLATADLCSQVVAVIQEKRAASLQQAIVVEVPVAVIKADEQPKVEPKEEASGMLVASTAQDATPEPAAPPAPALEAAKEAAEATSEAAPPKPNFVMLTPGSYCKVDICARQMKHGVGEASVRSKLVNDGMSPTRAERILGDARRVLEGAALHLVPGKNVKVSITLAETPGDAAVVVIDPVVAPVAPVAPAAPAAAAPPDTPSKKDAWWSDVMEAVADTPQKEKSDTSSKSQSTTRVESAVKARPPKRDNAMSSRNKELLGKFFESRATQPLSAAVDRSPVREACKSPVQISAPVAVCARASAGDEEPQVTYAQHPVYSKYFKMLKVGLPAPFVQNKMVEEGVDPSVLDNDPTAKVRAKPTSPGGVALSEHPVYAKYFKMLKVGLPVGSVKNKMTQEGVDPCMLDRDPSDVVKTNEEKNAKMEVKFPKSAKKKEPRKKKFHWNTIETNNMHASSLWAEEDSDVAKVDIDEEEFNSLFVEVITSPKRPPMAGAKAAPALPKKKKTVYLIDMKKGQNAAIALARIKLPFSEVRSCLERLDDSPFSPDQLQNMVEYLPTAEEDKVLRDYAGDAALLGQAEKFMLEMLQCTNAAKSLACLQFKHAFSGRTAEILGKISIIEKACDDVKSTRLKKVLKTVLQVGNQMNGNQSNVGFTLDSLLKLSSAKAFDKTTSLLTYIIMIIHRNDEDCLKFPEDVQSAQEASRLATGLLQAEFDALKSALLKTYKDVDILSSSIGTAFPTLAAFLVQATRDMQALEARLEGIAHKFRNVLIYFGETASTTSDTFFSTLSKFVSEFSAARDAFLKKKLVEESKAARAALSATKAASKGTPALEDGPGKENRGQSVKRSARDRQTIG